MNNDLISELDKTMLINMGVDPIKLNDYQILCLPENFRRDYTDNLFDADLSCKLSKKLKQNGVRCANSYDLGIDSKIAVRQNNDVYLGLIWILDKIAVPILITIICDWFKEKRNENNGNTSIKISNLNNSILINNNFNCITNFDKNNIHVEIILPDGKTIKHDGDAKTLKRRLNEEYKE